MPKKTSRWFPSSIPAQDDQGQHTAKENDLPGQRFLREYLNHFKRELTLPVGYSLLQSVDAYPLMNEETKTPLANDGVRSTLRAGNIRRVETIVLLARAGTENSTEPSWTGLITALGNTGLPDPHRQSLQRQPRLLLRQESGRIRIYGFELEQSFPQRNQLSSI